MDRACILARGERAENLIDDLSEIIYHLKEVAERLEGSDCRVADFLPSIVDAIDAAEDEKQDCEKDIAEAQAIEDRELEREYWEAIR